MKKYSLYSLVLLTSILIVFFSIRFVTSKDNSVVYHGKDSIHQGNSNTEISPEVSKDKCGKYCCTKCCGKSKCNKETKKDEDVNLGKNPNINNPDTTKSNIVPQEDKK